MDRVRKMTFNGTEILILDYSGGSGEKLIAIFEEARKLALAENKPCAILSIFDHKTFISPSFVRHVETHLGEVDHLIDKQAIIGLSKIQEWILKGVNLWYRRQILSFETKEKALEYLTNKVG